ncbi:uncharacterized protein [Diadema antillarum]|uniref:uncharacterized protein n=1 Tax=Diadema antillarum TaxID=105358 RepID=UPI003A843977
MFTKEFHCSCPCDRVEPSPPFTFCGLDCFGPFTIKEGRKELKRYGLILTCMSMRAVHIEVLDDMSTDAFLNSLRCFIAIRGNVRLIRCDQGSNFMGAKHELKKGLFELDENQVATQLLKINCEFRMNPPASSHMGGVWERQIRNVRNVLNGILDPSGTLLSTSSLRTFLYEAMAIINSRPLTVEDLECPDGPLPLTPNHVLTMKSGLVLPPPGQFVKEDLYLRKRWRRVQHLVNLFWARWKKEYLHTLQARKTSSQPQPNIEANDIVILQNESLCRTDWRIAKVIETISSDDGLVRRATLLMATPDLDEQGKPLHKRSRVIPPSIDEGYSRIPDRQQAALHYSRGTAPCKKYGRWTLLSSVPLPIRARARLLKKVCVGTRYRRYKTTGDERIIESDCHIHIHQQPSRKLLMKSLAA